MAKGLTPTQRTLAYLRDQGYTCGIVERWVASPKHPGGGFRQDLLNIIDIVALRPGEILGVQSCGASHSEHRRKILDDHADSLQAWVEAGGTFKLVSWTKRKRRTQDGSWGVGLYWTPREEVIELPA